MLSSMSLEYLVFFTSFVSPHIRVSRLSTFVERHCTVFSNCSQTLPVNTGIVKLGVQTKTLSSRNRLDSFGAAPSASCSLSSLSSVPSCCILSVSTSSSSRFIVKSIILSSQSDSDDDPAAAGVRKSAHDTFL